MLTPHQARFVGRALAFSRRALGYSMEDVARILGCTVAELDAIESGDVTAEGLGQAIAALKHEAKQIEPGR